MRFIRVRRWSCVLSEELRIAPEPFWIPKIPQARRDMHHIERVYHRLHPESFGIETSREVVMVEAEFWVELPARADRGFGMNRYEDPIQQINNSWAGSVD